MEAWAVADLDLDLDLEAKGSSKARGGCTTMMKMKMKSMVVNLMLRLVATNRLQPHCKRRAHQMSSSVRVKVKVRVSQELRRLCPPLQEHLRTAVVVVAAIVQVKMKSLMMKGRMKGRRRGAGEQQSAPALAAKVAGASVLKEHPCHYTRLMLQMKQELNYSRASRF